MSQGESELALLEDLRFVLAEGRAYHREAAGAMTVTEAVEWLLKKTRFSNE